MSELWTTARIASLTHPAQIAPDLFINPPLTVDHLNVGNLFGDQLEAAEMVVPTLPHSGFGYSITDGFCLEIMNAFGLRQLQEIKQFGVLDDVSTLPPEAIAVDSFYHNRLTHSLDVWAIGNLIVTNNQDWFTARPGFAKAFLVACLTHDVATAAGGDTMKIIDAKAFDEEANFPLYNHRTSVQELYQQYQIYSDLVVATVQGSGPLGQLLDIADKIAYVARDLGVCFGSPEQAYNVDFSVRLADYQRTDTYVCGLWQDVRIEGETPYFVDPTALTHFLMRRARLFKEVYTHPKNRSKRTVLYAVLAAFCLDQKLITPTDLVFGDDHLLERTIDRLLPGSLFQWTFWSMQSEHQGFATLDEAAAFKQTLVDQGTLFCLVEDVSSFFKPGTHLHVADETGRSPLHDCQPDADREISEAGKAYDPIRVYYLPDYDLDLSEWTSGFAAWRRQWHK